MSKDTPEISRPILSTSLSVEEGFDTSFLSNGFRDMPMNCFKVRNSSNSTNISINNGILQGNLDRSSELMKVENESVRLYEGELSKCSTVPVGVSHDQTDLNINIQYQNFQNQSCGMECFVQFGINFNVEPGLHDNFPIRHDLGYDANSRPIVSQFFQGCPQTMNEEGASGQTNLQYSTCPITDQSMHSNLLERHLQTVYPNKEWQINQAFNTPGIITNSTDGISTPILEQPQNGSQSPSICSTPELPSQTNCWHGHLTNFFDPSLESYKPICYSNSSLVDYSNLESGQDRSSQTRDEWLSSNSSSTTTSPKEIASNKISPLLSIDSSNTFPIREKFKTFISVKEQQETHNPQVSPSTLPLPSIHDDLRLVENFDSGQDYYTDLSSECNSYSKDEILEKIATVKQPLCKRGALTYPSPPAICHFQGKTGNNKNTSTPLVRRTARDEFLIQKKKAGMSYREIKREGGFIEPESTLRGRFRTLTKAKSARVRKPEWSDNDVHLLKQAVDKLGPKKSSGKIPWKKVASYILDNGGSYHFGNSTCRKRWDEIKNTP
ncbi:BgTH12-06526 [Blumeria graminis f. sp. triticale]|uniref:BgTH12-06526 n=1 Tax=Blumeria graminis f. sp. triticale TaxID=1689686 RepID=A0A9W4CYH3_BLUGR|nr:BgTH12-06526 [Blumeria graminis f. sp. triticale]